MTDLPKPAHLQGTSLVPLLDKPDLPGGTAAFHVYPRNTREHGRLLGQAVRTDRWRYVEWQKADGTVAARELYDMRDDPDETLNVAERTERAETVSTHSTMLKARLATPAPEGLKLLDPRKP